MRNQLTGGLPLRGLFTAAALLLLAGQPSLPALANDGAVLALVGGTVFDGTGAPARQATVIVAGDRIRAVGPHLAVPKGATIIDVSGKAILPGLFDLHTHWTPEGEPRTTPQIAAAYVAAGVTTVFDFHQQPESFEPRRKWLASLMAPHVQFVARISTPGGHGAAWGDQNTTIWINSPQGARAAVERLKPYKPDAIKIFTDGWRYDLFPDNSSMDEKTLHSLVAAAHHAGWPVLTHTVTVDRGLAAARADVDVIAHALQDRPIDRAAIGQFSGHATGLAPTLAVYEPGKYAPDAPFDEKQTRQFARKFETASHNVRKMHAAGIPIGVATDSGMTNIRHGVSTQRELELLVQAGLSASEALVAATSTSARLVKLDHDRGTIAPGQRADLLVVNGKPWQRITDIYRVNRVLIDGRLIFGEGAPGVLQETATTHLPPVSVQPLIDDFERPDGRTALDTVRLDTFDGGVDRSSLITQIVPGGTKGHILQLAGRMSAKDDAFVGVIFPLSRGSVAPADLSSYRGVRFDLNGEGPFTVRLYGPGSNWAATIEGSADWQTVDLPFSRLKPEAGRHVTARAWDAGAIFQVEISATRPGGHSVSMQLDNMAFY
ncbi:MAG: CIA30 family protein [Sphingosinicella sp.]|nr:CIA30 family protein [Sphingosinicella sp.]